MKPSRTLVKETDNFISACESRRDHYHCSRPADRAKSLTSSALSPLLAFIPLVPRASMRKPCNHRSPSLLPLHRGGVEMLLQQMPNQPAG
jgi:hypothetical protein